MSTKFSDEDSCSPAFKHLRTKVRGDFDIHGTKYFQDVVFHQKSKKYDVVSLLFLWWAKKPVLSMLLVITENAFGRRFE